MRNRMAIALLIITATMVTISCAQTEYQLKGYKLVLLDIHLGEEAESGTAYAYGGTTSYKPGEGHEIAKISFDISKKGGVTIDELAFIDGEKVNLINNDGEKFPPSMVQRNISNADEDDKADKVTVCLLFACKKDVGLKSLEIDGKVMGLSGLKIIREENVIF